jgi:hypothetical protein
LLDAGADIDADGAVIGADDVADWLLTAGARPGP